MELQFQKQPLPGLQLLKQDTRCLEETQELRLSDGMPDVGRVLGAWGQVLLRSKEWRSGSAHISGGVQAWILYIPEEGGAAQCVETWIPFHVKWDLPQTPTDGTIVTECMLRSADVRSTASRKMIVRVHVNVTAQMWLPAQSDQYVPGELPEDIRLLQSAEPVCLPSETGEKPFTLEEELTIPTSSPKIEKLMYCSLQPEIAERKIMTDKLVFRGAVMLHILYRSVDGGLYPWDAELPFSQYAELEREYDPGSCAWIFPAVTSLEADVDMEGRVRLKIGLTGQYVICGHSVLTRVQDAYSPVRETIVQTDRMELPMVQDEQQLTLTAEQALQTGGSVIDVIFLPEPSRLEQVAGDSVLQMSGRFQVLSRDENDQMQTSLLHWDGQCPVEIDDGTSVLTAVKTVGCPQTIYDGNGVQLRAEVLANARILSAQGLPMVTGLQLGQPAEPDPNRPSLILRRAGENTLWEIAKSTGSTVEAIMGANQLDGQPEPERMLLIPVV